MASSPTPEGGHGPLASGFYCVIQGRARLLDDQAEQVMTLQLGDTFGARSHFPEAEFRAYSVRASLDLVLVRLPDQLMAALSASRAWITFLYQEALVLDGVLLGQRRSSLRSLGAAQLQRGLRQAAIYELPAGPLRPGPVLSGTEASADFVLDSTELASSPAGASPAGASPATSRIAVPLAPGGLWILRRGSLVHVSGKRLPPGSVLLPDELTDLRRDLPQWHAESPLELMGLTAEQWLHVQRPPMSRPVETLPQTLTTAATPAASRSRRLRKPGAFRPKGTTKSTDPSMTQVGHADFPHPKISNQKVWQWALRRYPFVAQQSAVDCGVACLAMVGQFWGKRLDVNQLRITANVDRSGTSLKGLMLAAESVGFATRPVQATLEQLAKQQLPAIAHWEGKHFVVVYRITPRRIYLSDPGIGRLQLTPAQFQQGWTGYTLLMQPTAFLERAPEAKRDLGRFVTLIRPHLPILLEVLMASLMVQVFGLFMPLLTQMLLDRVVTQRSESTFFAVSLGLIIFSLFSLVMRSLRRYLLYHTANKIDLSLITGFIGHTLRLPLSYFETRYVGDITSRVQENRKIRRFLTGEAITTLLDVLTLFIYLALMLWYSWQMTIVALLPIPLFLIITLATTPTLQRISREVFAAKTAEGSYLIETLNGVGTIKSMGLERSVRWRWEGLFHKAIRIRFSGRIFREKVGFLTSLIETAAGTGLMILGVWLVLQQRLSIGQLFAFNMMVGRVVGPFQRLISLWNDFQEILIAVERLNDVIDTPPEEDSRALGRLTLPPLQGKLRFEQVCFRYDIHSDVQTLDNLNFAVEPGQTVALVGRSGSGKTTISKLLLGLYQPTQGRVWIDDYDLSTVSLESLRQQVGVVDQNTFLFGGTIRENIAIAQPDATLEAVQEAARMAGAAVFIETMPMKYDTQIGEGGGMLSGGQRQRLAIARALLGRPPLLILDEATSSLDAESERVIQDNLGQILHQQTTLVIAHRLSTVRHADLILMLDDGVIVERGTHDELMARKGQYYYLNQQQFT